MPTARASTAPPLAIVVAMSRDPVTGPRAFAPAWRDAGFTVPALAGPDDG
jgi:hypothetical protein